MATAASIEVIIRARDEASAAVATSMQKITTSAREAETAIGGMGRAGPAAANALGDLVRTMDQGSGSAGAMIASLGSLAAFIPGWGQAIALGAVALGGLIDYFERASQEAAKFQAALEALTAEQLQASGGREDIVARRADERAQALRAAGDAAGAAAAAEEAASARRRSNLIEEIALLDKQQAAMAKFREQFGQEPGEDFAGRNAEQLARLQEQQQAAAERIAERAAKQQADLAEQAARKAEQARKQQEAAEERAAQKRLQASLQAIDGERQIELAIARATARRAEGLAAQLAGVAQVHAVEMRAITESADARARAARGPGREEDVLAIRAREAQQVTQLAIRTADEVSRIEEARAQERSRRIQAEADELRQRLQEAQRAAGVAPGQETVSLGDLLGNQGAAYAQAQQRAYEQHTFALGGRVPLRNLTPELYESGSRQLGLTVADGFGAAAESTDKLTASVQALAGAFKTAGAAAPELIQKISQGLAEALTFAGQRHP